MASWEHGEPGEVDAEVARDALTTAFKVAGVRGSVTAIGSTGTDGARVAVYLSPSEGRVLAALVHAGHMGRAVVTKALDTLLGNAGRRK